jgi:dihydrofolate reductase
MGKVVVSLTMSLDGFIARPNDDLDPPPRHPRWHVTLRLVQQPATRVYGERRFKPKGKNREVVEEVSTTADSSLTGRRTYDVAGGWNGAHPVNGIPVVVLTHHVPDAVPRGRSTSTFTDGLENAVEVAKKAAGDKDVGVAGASVAQQCVRANGG